jgi:hypothetical protein
MAPTTSQRRQAPALHHAGQLRRHLRQRQRRVHQVGAQEDHEDHGRRLGRGVEALLELAPGDLALGQRRHEGGRRTHRRAFGGRELAAVDAAEDDDEDHAIGSTPHSACSVRRGAVVVLGRLAGHHAHVDGDGRDVAQHGDQARHHGRGKQLGDVLLGQDGVDDQRHRRRDQDAQRAAGGQRAGGQAAGVAVARISGSATW